MHKNTKLLPRQRAEIFRRWGQGIPVAFLAREYKVSRKTIYGRVRDARLGVFLNRSSMNHRYRSLAYGLKKLELAEAKAEKRLRDKERRARRYERAVPGELVHLDTKRLPYFSFHIGTIQTDNCPVFGRFFPDACVRSASAHRHIHPRPPNENGHLERFNRTLREEMPKEGFSMFVSKDIPLFCDWYNTARPHMGIRCKMPAEMLPAIPRP